MSKKFFDDEDYYYEEEQTESQSQSQEFEFGCGFCWDKRRQKNKELFFLDAANNMRVCSYCPSCGRKYQEDY